MSTILNHLVAEEVCALGFNDLTNPILEIIDVEEALELGAHRGDARVVLVLSVCIKESWVHRQCLLQVKRLEVEQSRRINLALLTSNDLCVTVVDADATLDRLDGLFEPIALDEVDLVEQNAVGEGHLLNSLVLNTLRLFIVEALDDVLGVDHSDDAIEDEVILSEFVDEEGLRNRGRVGQTRGLDDDGIKELNTAVEVLERNAEVAADRAANATVDDLNHFLGSILREDFLVDTDRTVLVLDYRETEAVGLIVEDVVKERGLS